MIDCMTLDEFTRELGNRLEHFVNATKLAQAEGEDGFVGDQFERRSFEDWMGEFAAHDGLCALATEMRQYLNRTRPTRLIDRTNKVAIFDPRRARQHAG